MSISEDDWREAAFSLAVLLKSFQRFAAAVQLEDGDEAVMRAMLLRFARRLDEIADELDEKGGERNVREDHTSGS